MAFTFICIGSHGAGGDAHSVIHMGAGIALEAFVHVASFTIHGAFRAPRHFIVRICTWRALAFAFNFFPLEVT